MPTILNRIKAAWNAFSVGNNKYRNYGLGSGVRPDKPKLVRGTERSLVISVYNRIAMDCALNRIEHVSLRDDGSYQSTVQSSLNECLTLSPNIDQVSQAFMRDVILSMFDEGCVAIVPVETDIDPEEESSYDILQIRCGKILEWYPQHVKVKVYNDKTGLKEDIVCAKKDVAIIENPLYSVINEPNSTMQRLIRKLALLDISDEKVNSSKLDLIIGLPYVVRTEAKKIQAEQRMKDIEDQLANGRYGIAYTDGTEHITQLNRPVENNLIGTIEYLTGMLYSQLGITEEIMNGTADEKAMLNYLSRTIEPIMDAITLEMTRKFLTKTARAERQAIRYYRDQFKLVPMSELAEMSDKLTRNEIMSSNEIRSRLGLKPSDDPDADKLKNKNMPDQEEKQGSQIKEPKNKNPEEILEKIQKPNQEVIQNE